MEDNDGANKDGSGLSKETELRNSVKDVARKCDSMPFMETVVINRAVIVTMAEEFSLFPKLAPEIRDMIWDYGIDLTTTPSLVHMDAQSPNFPLLTHVCHQARAACLRRYSAFRNAALLAHFQEFQTELIEFHIKKFPKACQYLT